MARKRVPSATLALIAALAILTSAAPAVRATIASGNLDGTLQSGGRTRTYHVHVPPLYDATQAAPLVFILHGSGGTGVSAEGIAHFSPLADAHTFIAVYPDGVDERWAGGAGTNAPERMGVDDVRFIVDLLDRLMADYTVDARRMYVTGISNGGFMAERLACEAGDRFAAIGVIAAAVAVSLAPSCPTQPALPIIFMHGTDDPVIPASGGMLAGRGSAFLSTMDSVAFWVRHNGCVAPPASTDLPLRVRDGTRVREDAYTGCRDGADVTYYEIEGAGHIWPGGPQYLPIRIIGRTTRNLDGSAALWSFFAAHPKPTQ